MQGNIVLREIFCKTALSKTGIPGYEYCMNPYVGCAHSCIYCYASFMCRFTGHREKWGEFLDVKTNFPEVLARQLGSRRKRPEGRVLLGSVTDAYQPVEARYEITRSVLKALADYQQLQVHILTKSALVQRDLPILRQLQDCEVGFTITALDQKVARVIEPGASLPKLRIAAARKLIEADIPVWVFIAPLLPGLSDSEESLTSLLRTLRESGIKEILLDCLNPYPAVVHRLKTAYHQHFPGALPELEEYLSHPVIYRAKSQALLRQIGDFTGCRPYFV
ncbi:MAG: spore photoproduct lyase family protein [Eubacteriales bacterium]